ncbi:hypothetical protein DH2020_006186 [Rehmannia glutinosa]|uniref:RING-type E3 ubiquitin transferase n=1 Tax=Rehmannia glutinosa TaxID=99300 RepID=A0ABR0XI94_REHGL
MEKILEILILFFSFFFIAQAGKENVCPTSYCGSFSIDYPFKLQNSKPQNDCYYMNLTCNNTLGNLGQPIVNLPYSGNFNVRYIGYYDPYIVLYDPENCLMRRLMNLNLSSSPFKAIAYENYTFYMCPSDASPIGYYVFPIDCLSNNTNSTVATALAEPDTMLQYGCKVIGSWLLPVLEPHQFEFNGINDDLYLGWNSTSCKACQENDPPADTGGSEDNLWRKFAESPYFITSFVALATFCVICILQIIRFIAGRYEINSNIPTADVQPESATATTGPPRSTVEGMDESKINSCTELVVVSENRRNTGTESNTCSICLESYLPKDVVRSIAKCEHCFHAECIELWLRKNRTCPVCRTVLVDVEEL